MAMTGKARTVFISLTAAAVALSAAAVLLYAYRVPLFGVKTKKTLQNTAVFESNQNQDRIVKGKIEYFPTMDSKDRKKYPDRVREKELGIENSFDMIVESDEQFKIGEITISMRDIVEKSFLREKKIFEEKINESGKTKPGKIEKYGIYIVKPGDNLWNIHFDLIKEYYRSRGLTLPDNADEPLENNASSGVGKILKFSEKLVTIYNTIENRVDDDINLLEPLSKIVVYNMNEVFALLKKINYKNMDKIRFDGETIWIAAHNNL
ncbi:MAG: hypothetical protein R6U68_00925 [Desulfobacteraceae bacterium]